MAFLQSPLSIPLFVLFVYIWMRGFLGVMFELANWTLTKLDGPGQ